MNILGKNKYGKISCACGYVAFLLSILAAHSEQHLVYDFENHLLAPIINFILVPLNYLERILLGSSKPVEPTVSSLGLRHVFEHEAIVVFYTVAVVLGLSGLYLVIKGIKENEFSFWYANGAFSSILAISITNAYLGIVATIFSIFIGLKIRRNGVY
ncbi:MAG: hypothetical protein OEZ58_18845 [Gammaproteobacteria bacterium]|nr:hypothetical protein [Gammaproteobacteria bacterium]